MTPNEMRELAEEEIDEFETCDHEDGRMEEDTGAVICRECDEKGEPTLAYALLGAAEEIERLQKALRFYAEKRHYDDALDTLADETFFMADHEGNVRVEDGSRARAALGNESRASSDKAE